jgi:pimeloyl-ACP methyl ester carboxylesterase
LQDHQTAFAVDCLRWLRQRHGVRTSANALWRVIVVGHSMGGIVARAAIARLAADATFGEACQLFLFADVAMGL